MRHSSLTCPTRLQPVACLALATALLVGGVAAAQTPPENRPAPFLPFPGAIATPVDQPTLGGEPLHAAAGRLTPDPLPHLRTQPGCDVDHLAAHTLPRHGEALLKGVQALAADPANAGEHFTEAVRHLGAFNASLYCVGVEGLWFWDSAISDRWTEALTTPGEGLAACRTVMELWNPALLVVDALQHTGESKIVDTVAAHGAVFEGCLTSYPIDSYGAAWLDEFGTGELVRTTGAVAHENLLTALQAPVTLGLGVCPLLSHANKMDPSQPCMTGLYGKCLPGDLLDSVFDLGLAYISPPTGPSAAQNGYRQNTAWMPVHQGPAEGAHQAEVHVPVTFFNTSLDGFGGRLDAGYCGGGKASRQYFSAPSQFADFRCIMGIMGGGEVPPASKVLQCRTALSQQMPSLPELSGIQVALPTTGCEEGNWLKKVWDWVTGSKDNEGSGGDAETRVNARPQSGDSSATGGTGTGGTGTGTGGEATGGKATGGTATGGPITVVSKPVQVFRTPLGKAPAPGPVKGQSGNVIIINATPGQEVTVETGPDGYRRIEVKPAAGTGDLRPNPYKTPVDGDGCTTAAERRAMAFYDCVFGGPQVAGGFGVGPFSFPPPSQTGALPHSCDQVADNWGAANGPGVTDPQDPSYWKRHAGPMVYDVTAMPGYGVIDPPKIAISVQRIRRLWTRQQSLAVLPGDDLYPLKLRMLTNAPYMLATPYVTVAGPLDDPRVLAALKALLPWDHVLRDAFPEAAGTVVLSSMKRGVLVPDALRGEPQPDLARALLEEAGFQIPIRVDVAVEAGDLDMARFAKSIQAGLALVEEDQGPILSLRMREIPLSDFAAEVAASHSKGESMFIIGR